MRRMKKFATVALATTLVASSLAGCSGSSGKRVSDGGKVLNIYVWNEEFKERVEAYYPGYEVVDATTGKIGDVTVKFTIVANAENGYQNNLDNVLMAAGKNQGKAKADDKIDIFLVEADYALKYTGSDYTLALDELGLKDSDFANQYQYTKDVVTAGGKLKGASWQGCPGALIYRRDIAKEVFGSDDPATVQQYVKDWDTFLATAKTLDEKGYDITATAVDTFRTFSNNVTSKWVDDKNNIQIDPNIKKWVEMSKEMVDAGYTQPEKLWETVWSSGFYTTGNVFSYFGPAWMIDFSMQADQPGSVGIEGGWAVTEGPQGFYWGGTWVCAAAGTDNSTLVKDIILKMTTDEGILTKILTEKNDFVNNTKIVEQYKNDANFGNKVLGNQNPLGIFASGVSTVDLSNISPYDQGCNEEFQNVINEYLKGNYASYDDALAAFYKNIKVKYPDVVTP